MVKMHIKSSLTKKTSEILPLLFENWQLTMVQFSHIVIVHIVGSGNQSDREPHSQCGVFFLKVARQQKQTKTYPKSPVPHLISRPTACFSFKPWFLWSARSGSGNPETLHDYCFQESVDFVLSQKIS